MLHFRSNLQSNWENAQNIKLIQILDFNSSFRNIYMSCLPANLDVKSKPQDHMRQFKLRSRDDYLNYFKIYYTSSETFILPGVEVRLHKYFRKISSQIIFRSWLPFARPGPANFILSIRKAKGDPGRSESRHKKKIVQRDLTDNISLKWLVFGLRTNGIFMLHDLRNFVFVWNLALKSLVHWHYKNCSLHLNCKKGLTRLGLE